MLGLQNREVTYSIPILRCRIIQSEPVSPLAWILRYRIQTWILRYRILQARWTCFHNHIFEVNLFPLWPESSGTGYFKPESSGTGYFKPGEPVSTTIYSKWTCFPSDLNPPVPDTSNLNPPVTDTSNQVNLFPHLNLPVPDTSKQVNLFPRTPSCRPESSGTGYFKL